MRIIKIGAVWCPGCLIMKKVWNNIKSDYDNLDITELDYDFDSALVSKYNPGKVLPIVIFISKDGNELERRDKTFLGMLPSYEYFAAFKMSV